MQLTGQQIQQLREALLDAYPTKETLAMMVRIQLNEHLEVIAGGENLRVVVFNLVSWAEKVGKVDELVQGAYKDTPGNSALQQLMNQWRLLSLSDKAQPSVVGSDVSRPHVGPVSIDVFLSYSRKDDGAMRQVQETMRAAGLSVWTDEGLEPGTVGWQNEISEALRQARIVVVLLSPNSNVSTWVNNEIGYAQTIRKRIVPVLIAGDEATAIPINLINAQWVDGRSGLTAVITAQLLPLVPVGQSQVTAASWSMPSASMPDASPPRVGKNTSARMQYRGVVLTAAAALLVGALIYYVAERIVYPTQPSPEATPANSARIPSAADKLVAPPQTATTNDAPTAATVRGADWPMPNRTEVAQSSVSVPDALQASNAYSPSESGLTAANTGLRPAPRAGDVRDFAGVPFVYVAAGPFLMGSDPQHDPVSQADEEPQHTVTLPGFWIMRTEVTNAQYSRCVAARACVPPENDYWRDSSHAEHPVVNVDWNHASAYAEWAGGRLPTEAEWEKACRGTNGIRYPWGDQGPQSNMANFDNDRGTEPVGSHPTGASPYGALDMAGNVWEWTTDWYDPHYYASSPESNPSSSSGTYRALRGGAWNGSENDVRCAVRDADDPGSRRYDLGFRVVSQDR